MRGRRGEAVVETAALLLGRVPYGEADLIVQLFTETHGRVSGLARGARRNSKRFSGALEPMHTLSVSLVERPDSEIWPLQDSALAQPRLGLTSSLEAMTVAGRALGWLRKAAPARTAEPEAFAAANAFLDALDAGQGSEQAEGKLAAFGMRLLGAFGWGLELGRCVSCGLICPPERAALLNPERGGLVCRRCGGGPLRLDPELRAELIKAASGQLLVLSPKERRQALRAIERALGAHLGIR